MLFTREMLFFSFSNLQILDDPWLGFRASRQMDWWKERGKTQHLLTQFNFIIQFFPHAID
jgi:hypothetical protein